MFTVKNEEPIQRIKIPTYTRLLESYRKRFTEFLEVNDQYPKINDVIEKYTITKIFQRACDQLSDFSAQMDIVEPRWWQFRKCDEYEEPDDMTLSIISQIIKTKAEFGLMRYNKTDLGNRYDVVEGFKVKVSRKLNLSEHCSTYGDVINHEQTIKVGNVTMHVNFSLKTTKTYNLVQFVKDMVEKLDDESQAVDVSQELFMSSERRDLISSFQRATRAIVEQESTN